METSNKRFHHQRLSSQYLTTFPYIQVIHITLYYIKSWFTHISYHKHLQSTIQCTVIQVQSPTPPISEYYSQPIFPSARRSPTRRRQRNTIKRIIALRRQLHKPWTRQRERQHLRRRARSIRHTPTKISPRADGW